MTVLAALAAPAVLVCLITLILHRYESANDPAGTPPLSGRAVLSAWGWGIVALCLAGAFYPLGFFRFLWRPRGKAPAGRPGIVLLHGLYHNPSAWTVFSPALARAGFGRTRALFYNSFGSRCFEDIAVRLVAEIHAILHDTPRIVLVGHSMGGLLVRRLLADERIARATAAAVTIGAPHHGSRMAALALVGRPGRELLPDSPLFPALDALPQTPQTPKLNILSPADDMVLPTASCRTHGPGWTHWQSPPLTHVCLLHHPAVIRTTVDFLKSRGA